MRSNASSWSARYAARGYAQSSVSDKSAEFRFTPNSRHSLRQSECLLCAKSGLVRDCETGAVDAAPVWTRRSLVAYVISVIVIVVLAVSGAGRSSK